MTTSLRSKNGLLILSVTILVSGLGFLMASAVTIALPTIQDALGIGIANVQWIVNAYVLMLGSLILLSGALGDIFCAKRVFTTGTIVFTVSCASCALAWNSLSLIIFRAVQGAGAALMVPGSLTVINRTFREQERGRAIGLWAGISGGIAALGPLAGGVLADISWRWVFLSILPFGLLSIVMAIVFIPHLPGRKNARIDWVGALLILVSLGALSFSFITVSERGFAPGVLGWGIVGCIALVGFVIQNARSSDPLVPPAMFDRAVVVANVVTFFLYFAFQGVFFLLAFRLQQLHGYSARASGLALLPAIVLIALFTGPSGALTDKSGPRLQMIVGPLLVTAACAWWFVFHQGRFVTDILPGVILLGLGMVAAIPPVTKTALAVADRYSGAASGLNNGASRIAALFAIALAGSLLARVYAGSLNAQLQHRRFSSRIVRHERAHADQLLSAPLPAFGPRDELLRLRANAFSTGFRAAVALLGAAALCAGLVSLFRLPPQSPS